MVQTGENICVIGIWHLGLIYSACLADLGYNIAGVDNNQDRVKHLNQGTPPLFEPGIEKMLNTNLQAKRLRFTTDLGDGVKGTRYIIISYDTPVDDQDEVDLSQIWETVSELPRHLQDDVTVIISSQVPVGTCIKIKTLLAQKCPTIRFGIACCPENLRLGQAITRFKTPDRVVIGADDRDTLDRVEALFSVIPSPKVRMDLKSAEMVKHATNALLATSISFGNEIANLCDEVGADALKVAAALQSDERFGPKLPLMPGLGFAGGTLARDLKILKRLGDDSNNDTLIVDAVIAVNQRQNRVVTKKLLKELGSLEGRTIGVLGLTYKAGTSTLRRSSAIEIIQDLSSRGAKILAFDPKADVEEVKQHPEFQRCSDPYQVARSADALAVVTDWPEFKGLDYARIKNLMKNPLIIDARNMLDGEELSRVGFIYSGIGRGAR